MPSVLQYGLLAMKFVLQYSLLAMQYVLQYILLAIHSALRYSFLAIHCVTVELVSHACCVTHLFAVHTYEKRNTVHCLYLVKRNLNLFKFRF
jgi:hypothetical protein